MPFCTGQWTAYPRRPCSHHSWSSCFAVSQSASWYRNARSAYCHWPSTTWPFGCSQAWFAPLLAVSYSWLQLSRLTHSTLCWMDLGSLVDCLIYWIAPGFSPLCFSSSLVRTFMFFALLFTWIGCILFCSYVAGEYLSSCFSSGAASSVECLAPEPSSCPMMYLLFGQFQLDRCWGLFCELAGSA